MIWVKGLWLYRMRWLKDLGSRVLGVKVLRLFRMSWLTNTGSIVEGNG